MSEITQIIGVLLSYRQIIYVDGASISVSRSYFWQKITGLKTRFYLLSLLVLCSALSLKAQIKSAYAEIPPEIDGSLDDAVWQSSPSVTGFKTFVPDFLQDMPHKTVAYVAHDEENLYFAVKCFDDPNQIKTSIAQRDRIRADDWVCINLDSFNGGQSLYGLYINPSGIQMDTRFAAGNEDIGLDLIWYSAGKIVDDGYIVEARIPFKSIRYASNDGQVEMGVIFERRISRYSIQGTYPVLDPDQGFALLTQMMPLHYEGVKKASLVEILPAVTYATNKNQINGEEVSSDNFEPSINAKIGITSELVLDATINPDFSQVESDVPQVETNQRFPINFPERRPFFLEGNENFNFAGSSMFSPVRQVVNTRTIVSPRAATKLTGKIGERNILSAIYAVDRADESLADFAEDETADVGVVRYMRSFTQDSYFGLIGTGRFRNGAYNAVYGLDGQYRFNKANIISGHFLNSLTKADAAASVSNKGTATVRFNRNTRNFNGNLTLLDIAEDFRSDVGFVTRTGIWRISGSMVPKIFPKKGIVKRIDPTIFGSITKDKPSGKFEHTIYTSLALTLPRQTRISIDRDFSTEIYLGETFNDGGLSLSASSQISKRFFFRSSYRWDNGIYFQESEQGYGRRVSNFINWQMTDKINLQVNHNFVSLFSEETDAKYFDLHIARGRLVYQMNQYLFFRAIAQYNSLSKIWSSNFLASFTYIPGTVVHFGYGNVFERVRWDGTDYVPSDNYLQTSSGFFFKASYLWRL